MGSGGRKRANNGGLAGRANNTMLWPGGLRPREAVELLEGFSHRKSWRKGGRMGPCCGSSLCHRGRCLGTVCGTDLWGLDRAGSWAMGTGSKDKGH